MRKDVSIRYDKVNDILYLRKDKKIKESIDLGDLILDIDSEWNVVGVEFLNASEVTDLSKKELQELNSANFRTIKKRALFGVSWMLPVKSRKSVEKQVLMPIEVS